MKRIFPFLVLMLIFTMPLPAQVNKPTLAILDVVPVDVEKSQSVIVHNYILDQIHRSGAYSVVERSELEAAFAEMELSLTGAVDEATAVQVGKIAGAEYILLSSLAYSEGRYHVSLRIVSTASSRIVDTSAGADASFSRIERLVKEAVDQLLGQEPVQKAVTVFFTLEAQFSLGFPLGPTEDILSLAYFPYLEGRCNFSFPWGILSAGISAGAMMASTKESTPTAYRLITIPAGVSLGYTTNFDSPFFLGFSINPGAAYSLLVYPEEETGSEPKTFTALSFAALGDLRIGFALNPALSLYARGGFAFIQFSAEDYMAIAPGIGAAIRF